MGLIAQLSTVGTFNVGTALYGRIIVNIFDSTTGLPANGNNCVVTYTQNINGVSQNLTVTIGGLNSEIYSGELSDSTTGYFTNFTILSLTPGVGIPPDPAADDLEIVNIITTPESAIGANDGTVTINATSSFPAILYSLDNITFQSSNVFTGQISGLGTAYVTDANSGAVSSAYDVGLLGNILISDPTVDQGNGNLSRWNAAFNNIWFKYQRKDYQITGITLDVSSGNILVAVNADVSNVTTRTTITSLVPGQPNITSPGDFVYIKTANYAGSYEVLASTAGILTLNFPYVANDGTGFININSLRPYYNIQTKITYVDPITGNFNTITSINQPFPDGSCNVDLSSFLKSLLVVKDLSNYSLLNYRDMQLSASYTIQYAEVWNGNTPQWANITRPYYVLYTARQLQQLGGGNMQEFVPYLLGFNPAKWLTDFTNPVYNYNFPFDLSFIFSEYMIGLAPYFDITLLDINMNPLQDQSVVNAFLLNEDNSFQLNQDGSKFIIASQAIVNTPIVEHVGLNRLLVNFIPPSQCWYFKVQLKYDDPVTVTTYPLTQALICRIDQNTTDREVYLRWIGLTGSWNYYKFVYNQAISLEVTNEVTIKNYVTDWANSDTIEDVISKSAGQKMTVFAENVPVVDIKGLQSIKYSNKVQLYMGAGPTWQTVDVATGSYNEYETYIDFYSFNLTFALPSINTQNQ